MNPQKTKVDELRASLKKRKGAEEKTDALEEDLQMRLQAAEEEAKTHHDKMLRVLAEFENFRKRTERELITLPACHASPVTRTRWNHCPSKA